MTDILNRLTQSRFLRFLVVGGFGFIVAEAALWVARNALRAGDNLAWLVSFLCAVTFTWWGNRNLTFADRKASGEGRLMEYGRFLAANALGAAINFGVYKALIGYGHGFAGDPQIALAFGVLAGLVFNFTISNLVVFRGR